MEKSYRGNPGIAILHLIKSVNSVIYHASATEGEKTPSYSKSLEANFNAQNVQKKKRLLCNCYNPKQREISSVKPHQNIWTLGLLKVSANNK